MSAVRPARREGEGSDGASGSSTSSPDTSITHVGAEVLVHASALEIERGEVLAGRYQIEAVLGRGGSGIVLRAFDRVAREPVAIKILKPELAKDPRWIERFSRELRLARQIQHPNVCRVFDIAQADGHWFITMELATGGTLRDALGPEAPPRSLEAQVEDVRAVVEGLAAIHEAGIVHRDVKPDNFLRMADGRLVLSDFGLATNPADAPAVSIMVGTPHYMAPEVVMGEVATPRSDVWSTGVVVHEILCGERPPRGPAARRGRTPASGSGTRSPVLAACASALAEEPAERPANGLELRKIVGDALAGRRRARVARALRSRPSIVWGTIAVAAFGLTAVFARRLFQPAAASSARPPAIGTIRSVGAPHDWSVGAKAVATIEGRVHCFSVLPGGETARAIWGTPRRAEDIDLATGARRVARLAPETFQTGCPELSPDGRTLLYTRLSTSSAPEIMRAASDGTGASPITSGSEPQWLPSGDEFVYQLATAQAGVFTLPTMRSSFLAIDPATNMHALYTKTPSSRGDALSLIFESGDLERLLEVHSLPDLKVRARWWLPSSIRSLSYSGDSLLLSNLNGGALERLDPTTGESTRLGFVPGAQIQHVSSIAGGRAGDRAAGRLLLTRSRRRDVWLFAPGRPSVALTTDGHSFAPTWSSGGDVLFEREMTDGAFAIFAIDRDGRTRKVTDGPSDGVPSYVDGTNRWVYIDYSRKMIRSCEGDRCVDFLKTGDLLDTPVMSGDQRNVAFVSLEGIPHLHVVGTNGEANRDLGPTAIECSPIWTGASSLWGFAGAGKERFWEEFDVTSGKRTGRRKAASTFDPDEQRCGWENEPPGSPFYQRVQTVNVETWQALRTGPLLGLD